MKLKLHHILLIVAVTISLFAAVQALTVKTHQPVAKACEGANCWITFSGNRLMHFK